MLVGLIWEYFNILLLDIDGIFECVCEVVDWVI